MVLYDAVNRNEVSIYRVRQANFLFYMNIFLLTPFNFLFYSLHVSVSTGHPQVRYTISYLKDYFITTDTLHVCNLI
jgi:hypothetical protein